MPRIRRSSCSGWWAPRWSCSPSRSCSCATRSSRSCGWPTPPKASARAARCRTSARAARARCGAPRAAFIEMKSRIERAIEQRTAMLAGVSHDLRTILTRFKLELALIGDSPEVEAMKQGRRRDGRACWRPISPSRAAISASRRRRPTWRPSLEELRSRRRAPRPQRDRGVPRAAGRHGAAGRVQALPRQSGVQRRALRADRSRSPAIATTAI